LIEMLALLAALLAGASLVVGVLVLRSRQVAATPDDLKQATDILRAETQRVEQSARTDAAAQRQELAQQLVQLAQQQRSELGQQRSELDQRVAQLEQRLDSAFNGLSKRVTEHVQQLLTTTGQANATQAASLAQLQTALREQLALTRTEITAAVAVMSKEASASLGQIAERVTQQLATQNRESGESMEKLRSTVEVKLASIQSAADAKLEQMRITVDEKLSSTLNTRLGESFKLVSDRLEAVQNGFGEMRSLAGNVTDLRRLMTNVKTRGVWGEVQLSNLLDQLFTEAQYERNFRPRLRSAESVEFALKLPGPDTSSGPVYLPIDSKFPIEDFQRLVEATEAGDVEGAKAASKALENRIYGCARDIRDKYINVPTTTNFAVLFLPTEALYAEVAKMPGLLETLVRDYRVVAQGPTNFSAFAMSLLMGFSTLAIQRRSADIAKLLGAVKTDFGKFGDLLAKVESKLDDAKDNIGKARERSVQIVKKLGRVEDLPQEEARLLLPDPSGDPDAIPDATSEAT
jgi:DNA recombination protein RmuC